jgi:hypothetical protein
LLAKIHTWEVVHGAETKAKLDCPQGASCILHVECPYVISSFSRVEDLKAQRSDKRLLVTVEFEDPSISGINEHQRPFRWVYKGQQAEQVAEVRLERRGEVLADTTVGHR